MSKPSKSPIATTTAATGRCACGAVRYALTAPPLIVHACHCRDCQRLTGSAFAVNLWIERAFVDAGKARLKAVRLAGGSGRRHDVFSCAACATQLWSRYHVAADALFVRAGTLDEPAAFPPDVHIFTRSKAPWLELPADARAFGTFYRIDRVWSAESKARLRRSRAGRP